MNPKPTLEESQESSQNTLRAPTMEEARKISEGFKPLAGISLIQTLQLDSQGRQPPIPLQLPFNLPGLQKQQQYQEQQSTNRLLPSNSLDLPDPEAAKFGMFTPTLHDKVYSQAPPQVFGIARLPVFPPNQLHQNLPLNSLPPKPIYFNPLPNAKSQIKPMGGQSPTFPQNLIKEKYDDDDLLVDKPNSSDQKMQEENVPTDISDQIHLTMKLKNKYIQLNSASAQMYPMIASLSVDDLKVTNRAAVDLICVIDSSGSMAGEKIRLLMETLSYLLTLLSDDDRLCIIEFNSKASRLSRLIKMTKEGKSDATRAISKIRAEGGTNIAAGMEHAFRVIQDRRTRNAVTGVFLLSDGIDGGAELKVKKLLEDSYLEENFSINCFGYGEDHSPDLMTKISELKDGTFFYIEKYDQLEGCFVDCLGGLISVVAENVKLQVKIEPSESIPDIKIVKCFANQNLWTEDVKYKSFTIKLEQIVSGKTKDFVFLVQIPPVARSLLDHEKNVAIASAKCEMKSGLTDSKELLVKNAELSIAFQNEDEEFKADEADRDVMINFYRVRAAEILSESRTLADQRKYQEAQKLIKDFKEELMNSQLKQEPLVVKLVEHCNLSLGHVTPEQYPGSGRHSVYQSYSVLNHQQSHPDHNMFSTPRQMQMQSAHMSRKH